MNESIERARDGDRSATDAVAASLRPRLEKMAAYYARRCGEDPDDLLQEAWLGLLEALPSLDIRIGSPEQYLIQRAKWRLLDWVKRSRLRRCQPLEEAGTEVPTAWLVDEALAAAAVREFLVGLNPSQQTLLRCLMMGLTWREAGSVLGCTSANVAYHVRRIRRQYEVWSGDDA